MKIPTDEDYYSYNGAHTSILWNKLNDYWRCPACNRTKREIMRWTKRFIKGRGGVIVKTYYGWMAALHTHHDHGGDCEFEKSRFHKQVVCDHCNAADGRAKRILGLPSTFSFSPKEIGKFITATPHAGHKTNYGKAKEIYDRLMVNK